MVHPIMAHRYGRDHAFTLTVFRGFLIGPAAYVCGVIIFETTIRRQNSLARHGWGGHTLFKI